MSSQKIYKWVAIVAIVAGTMAACHYKAGFQYKDEDDVPAADSGTRQIITTAMPADSTNTIANPAIPSGPNTDTLSPAKAHAAKPDSAVRSSQKPKR